MWKEVRLLKEPFNDAVNYRGRAEREFFNKIFMKTDELERCLQPSIYFLMGEKGSGKTAYATYLENNTVNDAKCRVVTMTETQYKRFVELKRDGKLSYSDYGNIWRFILLLIVSQVIIDKSKNILNSLSGKFSKIEKLIGRWNKSGLNPEIDVAFEAIRQDSFKFSISAKDVAGGSYDQNDQFTEKRTGISHNIFEGELAIKDAISDLKMKNNHVIFIDGIDFRPSSIDYKEYLDCVKGLGEAVWQLNTEFFRNIRDSTGRIKIVLLVRPDVFHALNLYNSNSRIQDNSVYLDWSTTDKDCLGSNLFEASGKYFSSQQSFKPTPEESWNHYMSNGEVFKTLLRNSFQKPRDILTFLKQIRKIQIDRKKGSSNVFDTNIISDPSFTKMSSDYLLGEVRNYAAFYMSPEDFAAYLKFFQYLDGKSKFDMDVFNSAYLKFSEWLDGENISAKEFARDPEALLQFFYDVNIVGYKEMASDYSETFYHWSFRERSLNNLAPKIKTVESFIINSGIAKALDIGKIMRVGASDGVVNGRQKPSRRSGGKAVKPNS